MTDVKFYTEPSFIKENSDISYGFFTRKGGAGNDMYSGLNCGTGSEDAPENVNKNRQAVAQKMGVDARALLSLYQVHSSDVVNVDQIWSNESRPKADGFVTDKAEIALGIVTADCAPVLFYGQKSAGEPVIGAAHAGWKGALGGVLENTVQEMMHLGAKQESIRACIGPCISKSSYEVSEDFTAPFLEEDPQSEMFFHSAAKQGHLHFDLAGYCCWRLSRAGLKNITLMDIDTYSNEDEFFSYRRATHRDEPDYGRQISVITINR